MAHAKPNVSVKLVRHSWNLWFCGVIVPTLIIGGILVHRHQIPSPAELSKESVSAVAGPLKIPRRVGRYAIPGEITTEFSQEIQLPENADCRIHWKNHFKSIQIKDAYGEVSALDYYLGKIIQEIQKERVSMGVKDQHETIQLRTFEGTDVVEIEVLRLRS